MRFRLVLAALGLLTATVLLASLAAGHGARRVSYARDVQPILDRSCSSCHPASFPYLDLRRGRSWAQLVRVPATTNPAFERVLPGRPELSWLLIHPPDPSNARLLSAADLRIIARWIEQGARND